MRREGIHHGEETGAGDEPRRPKQRISANTWSKRDESSAEDFARFVIEQFSKGQFTDGEWAKQRGRLLEFVLTLRRWDRERQLQSEVWRQVEEEECKTLD